MSKYNKKVTEENHEIIVIDEVNVRIISITDKKQYNDLHCIIGITEDVNTLLIYRDNKLIYMYHFKNLYDYIKNDLEFIKSKYLHNNELHKYIIQYEK